MDRSSLRPLVGISACFKENGRGGWHHAVGNKYVWAAIHAVGALPVLIPAFGPEFAPEDGGMVEAMDRLLDALDGVLLTGSRRMSSRISMAALTVVPVRRTMPCATPPRCR